MSRGNDLKLIIEKFDELVSTLPDDNDSVPIFINFLRGFLRTRDPKHALPSAEIMTILKKQKPKIFYLLKKQAIQNPSLELLTQLEINYDTAVERLDQLKNKLK